MEIVPSLVSMNGILAKFRAHPLGAFHLDSEARTLRR